MNVLDRGLTMGPIVEHVRDNMEQVMDDGDNNGVEKTKDRDVVSFIKLSPETVYAAQEKLKDAKKKKRTQQSRFIDASKFDGLTGFEGQPHFSKKAGCRGDDYMELTHRRETKVDGEHKSLTEFIGGFEVELDQSKAINMQIQVLNARMSIFFFLLPRVFYVLPWQIRLLPEFIYTSKPKQNDQESDDEMDSKKDEEDQSEKTEEQKKLQLEM